MTYPVYGSASAEVAGALELALTEELAKPCPVVVPRLLLEQGPEVSPIGSTLDDGGVDDIVRAGQLSRPEVLACVSRTARQYEYGEGGTSTIADSTARDQRFAAPLRRLLELTLEEQDHTQIAPSERKEPASSDLLRRRDRLLRVRTGSLEMTLLRRDRPERLTLTAGGQGISCLAEAGERLETKLTFPVERWLGAGKARQRLAHDAWVTDGSGSGYSLLGESRRLARFSL